MMQKIIQAGDNDAALDAYFTQSGAKCVLLVCGNMTRFPHLHAYFSTLGARLGIRVVQFSDFQPNPQYESVVRGAEVFRENGCDLIAAVGGGSAMDVAKCIKLFSNMDSSRNYLTQKIVPNDVPLFAVPTTAGTGSEATGFAVIYYNGMKQSVNDPGSIPSAVLFDPGLLKTLPMYQRKATMLDALCHAVEAFWSVHSNEESMGYSREAIRMILANCDGYLANDDAGNANMLRAANIAGKAINITQTTAGHAMCYKLTGLYGIAHGHAAALCVKALIPHMMQHTEQCTDPRGEAHLRFVLSEIAAAFGCVPEQLAARFAAFVDALELPVPVPESPEDLAVLQATVSADRLKNHPTALPAETIGQLYRQILRQEAQHEN